MKQRRSRKSWSRRRRSWYINQSFALYEALDSKWKYSHMIERVPCFVPEVVRLELCSYERLELQIA